MKSNFLTIFIANAIITLSAVAAFAQDPGKPLDGSDTRGSGRPAANVEVRPTPKPTPVAKRTTLLFPEIEGWTKSEKTTYPTAALGYSYSYESNRGGRVTIYVYNGGNASISNDISSPTVKREFDGVRSEILAIGKAGIYQNMKEVKTDRITVGRATDAHYALFRFNVQGQPKVSELYLFSFEDNFIKIRATRSPENADDRDFKSLLAELVSIFEP